MPRRQSLRAGAVCVRICALAICLIGPGQTFSEDFSGNRFTLRGFGTVGATTHDVDDIEFRRTNGQAHGAKADDIDFGVDSLAGVQINARLNEKFDVVVQGVTRQRADGDWDPRLSQAYLRYVLDESLVLRAGRVGYDIYLLAESRQVGYSYPSLRPSPEFYGLITNDDLDGGDITYTRRLGPGLFRGRLFGGDSVGELAFEYGFHTESRQEIFGGTFDYLYRGWMWRVAAVDFHYDSGDDIPLLVAGLRATGFPSAGVVADDLDHDAYRSKGLQVGVAYDDGPLVAQVLWGVIRSDSIAGPDVDKLYGLIGYRVKAWTPFVSHVRSQDRKPVRDAGLPGIPQLAPLNAAVLWMQEATRSTQYTTSLGARYDLSSHIAFKVQLDHTHVSDTSLYLDYRPDAGTPFDMTVVAASVDFVF